MNILVTIPDNDYRRAIFKKEVVHTLESIGNVTWNKSSGQFSREELEQLLKSTEICIIGWHVPQITGKIAEKTPLKFIGYFGGSLKSVVSRDIFDTDIKVVGCNKTFAKPLAEGTLMLILMSLRKAYDYINRMKTEKNAWAGSSEEVNTLYGKTVGLLGYGSIASELVRLLKPFDVKIIVNDAYCTAAEAEDKGFCLVDKEELLARSDVLSIHHTLTDRTYHLLDSEALGRMKDNAIIVNTARGAIIDEAALIGELKKGRLFAALDVYEKEPLPPDSPLRMLSNVIPLPHVGGATAECREDMARAVIEDLQRFIKGEDLQYQETKEHYDAMTESIYFKH